MTKEKKPQMAYSMMLDSLEKFALESEEGIMIYGDLLREYLLREIPASSAIISLLCQGYSASQQLLDITNSNLIDPVYMKDDPEKVMILEEDMYMIETLALSKIYCANQLRRFSISTKLT
jgi:hypothetical protein